MTCKISKMEGDETSENYEKPKQMKYEQQQSRWKKWTDRAKYYT